jgi:hypothetical protein
MTRCSTPLHVRDEETLSSGDESDDADLTDGDSTDSEWADLEGKCYLTSRVVPMLKIQVERRVVICRF